MIKLFTHGIGLLAMMLIASASAATCRLEYRFDNSNPGYNEGSVGASGNGSLNASGTLMAQPDLTDSNNNIYSLNQVLTGTATAPLFKAPYINAVTGKSALNEGGLSLAFWFNPGSDWNSNILLSDSPYSLQFQSKSSSLKLSTYRAGNYLYKTNSSPVSYIVANSWHHYVVVLPVGAAPRWYRDGALITGGSTQHAYDIFYGIADRTSQGTAIAGGANSWTPKFDNVSVYSGTLSTSDVQTLYTSAFVAPTTTSSGGSTTGTGTTSGGTSSGSTGTGGTTSGTGTSGGTTTGSGTGGTTTGTGTSGGTTTGSGTGGTTTGTGTSSGGTTTTDPAPTAPAPPPTVLSLQLDTAKAGEAIALQGDGFTSITRIKLWVANTSSQQASSTSWVGASIPALPTAPPADAVTLTLASQTNECAIASIPAALAGANGVHVIYTSNDGLSWSRPQVFNKAKAFFLSRISAYPGQAVQVMGSHLQSGISANAVYLYGSGTVVACRIERSSDNALKFDLPSTMAPGTYQVWVHNGSGGQYGFDNSQTLQVVSNPGEPASVYKVTDYGAKADGSDATTAIQNAINAAAANGAGGVVYFPSGTYTITSGLTNPSSQGNLVIKGDGKTASVIKMSDSASYADQFVLSLRAASNYAQNTTSVVVHSLGINANGKRSGGISTFGRSHVTIDDVQVKCDSYPSTQSLYSGVIAISNGYNRDVTISNSILYGNDGIAFSNTIDGRVEGTTIYCVYPRTDREPDNDTIRLYGTRRITVSDNVMDRNTSADTSTTTYYNGRGVHLGADRVYQDLFGTTEAAFNEDIYCGFNLIRNTGQPGANDGELIVADGGIRPGMGHLLPVSSATSNSLTTSASTGWQLDANNTPVAAYAYIMAGKGVGQVRRITAATSNSVTVSPGWDVMPDTSSQFIVQLAHVRQIYANNTGTNNQKYIGLFGEGLQSIVQNNSVDPGTYQEGGVGLFSYFADSGTTPRNIYPTFYCEMRNNRLSKYPAFFTHDDYSSARGANATCTISLGNSIVGNLVSNTTYASTVQTSNGVGGGTWAKYNLLMRNSPGTNTSQAGYIGNAADHTVLVNNDPSTDSGTNTVKLTDTSTSSSSTGSNTTSVYLSDLVWTNSVNGWGPVELDMSNGETAMGDGHTITINGKTYAKGLGVHAASEVDYNLNGQYTSFQSDIGLDDEIAGGSVVFQVWLDGVKVFDSGTIRSGSAIQSLNLSVSGKNQLKLIVTDAGDGNAYDHADWAGARLTK